METLWFWLIAIMLAGYVILDGFDLGVGILHLWIANTDAERRTVIRSIGPVWDGNEVWILAAGGTLYFAFPALYASSFSGFYLPLMMVLWLLILRGISLEFRGHVTEPIWAKLCDAIFWLASVLLTIFYGAALGNVVRGVPLDANGQFFEPLWTNFMPSGQTGILDWYTVLVGIVALAVITLHGATWLAYKTEGELHSKSVRAASAIWWLVAFFTVALTLVTFLLLPHHFDNFRSAPWGFIFPLIAIAGLLGIAWTNGRKDKVAFLASCTYLAGMLTSVAFSLYPNVLPASTDRAYSLTVTNAHAGEYGLKIGAIWWLIGMALAVGYFRFVYGTFGGKVSDVESDRGAEY